MNPTAPIAENHIRISRSLFSEGMRAVESGNYLKSVKRLVLVLIIIFTAVAVWLLHTGGSLLFLLGECIFLGALLFWLIFMLPNTKRRSKYRSMTNGIDAIPERTVLFYPDHLIVRPNSGADTTIPYKNILDWQETKKLYILNCQNNIHVLLDKKGFITGNFDIVKKTLK